MKLNELPELSGTERQVNWANTIRDKQLKEISKLENKCRENGEMFQFWHSRTGEEFKISVEFLTEMVNAGIESLCDSKFWIDHRGSVEQTLSAFHDDILTVKPENIGSPDVAEIKITDKYLMIWFENPQKHAFHEFITKYEYHKFAGNAWIRRIAKLEGEISDRAGEIGSVLLKNGYAVKFPDMISKEKAISGNFIPEYLNN